jgi:thiopurine S-methyltransferase
MEVSYWQSRWIKNKIGFHSPVVNPYLVRFQEIIKNEKPKGTVLVPLCGKTPDMVWLREQGFYVIGVEVIDVACRAFFEENGLAYQTSKEFHFEKFSSQGIEIWCGSIFDLPDKIWNQIDWVYDRASIGALPELMRKKYMRLLNQKVPLESVMMMHCFEYDQSNMDGPPFSVSKSEIEQGFNSNWDIQSLFDEEVLSNYQRFKTRGISQLFEQVYWMKKKTN